MNKLLLNIGLAVRLVTPLRFKCWAVTHRAAFMGTAAGLRVTGVPNGMVWMVYRLSLNLASAGVVMVVSERHKKRGHIHFMLA